MKLSCIKKSILMPMLSAVTLICMPAIIIGLRFFPNVISYTADTSHGTPAKAPVSATASTLYSSLSDISENGPFKIRTFGDSIYIYSADTCLYRIQTSFSSLPATDKELVESGLEIQDKSSLFEIVEHMES